MDWLCRYRSPDELFDASVQEMSRRMEDLARKNKPKLSSSPKKPAQEAESEDEAAQPQPLTPSPLPGDATHLETPPKLSPPPSDPPATDPPPQPTPTPSPQALPTTPSPPPPSLHTITPPPPERVATPLETTLLQALQSKDLGSTGFVTRNELFSTLTQLSKGKAVSYDTHRAEYCSKTKIHTNKWWVRYGVYISKGVYVYASSGHWNTDTWPCTMLAS